MRFRNPANGYAVDFRHPRLGAMVCGPFYFAGKGMWQHAVIELLASLVTIGGAWAFYAIAARGIIRDYHLRMGWTEESIPLPPGPTHEQMARRRSVNRKLLIFCGVVLGFAAFGLLMAFLEHPEQF